MKRTETLLLIAAVMGISALTTGCRDDKSGVFTAITQNYSGAKDYIGGANGTMVFWNDGDAVRINDGTYTVDVSDGDGHRATIAAEGVAAYGGEYYAAYPANISTIAGNGQITFSLPQEEVYATSGGSQVIHSVMAAKSDGNNTLKFQNVCALLHFKVNGSGSGIGAKVHAIEVESDQPMWGTVTVNYSGGQWVVSSVSGVGATTRTLRFATPLVLGSAAKDVYLVVPPVTGATNFTLRMVVEHSDGTVKVFEKKKDASVNFTSGNMCHFDDVITYTGSMMKFGDNEVSANTMDGSLDHPYLVYSTESWNHLASTMATAGEHISLASDINVGSTLASNFKAILDGNGHTITLTTQNISLFSIIDSGTVRNVTIAATNDVTAPVLVADGANRFFGTLAGRAKSGSVIENCENKVGIIFDEVYTGTGVGGLLGDANGCTFSNCINRGSISANAFNIGGVVGRTSNIPSISGCKNYGNITVTTSSETVNTQNCGGIVGILSLSNNDEYATDCHNYGNITIGKASINESCYGGVFGQISCCVSNCSNMGAITCSTNVSKTKYVGGIAGKYTQTTQRTMFNCFNVGNIDAVNDVKSMTVGGLLGCDFDMNIIIAIHFVI